MPVGPLLRFKMKPFIRLRQYPRTQVVFGQILSFENRAAMGWDIATNNLVPKQFG